MARPRLHEPDDLRKRIVGAARDILRDADAGALTARTLAGAIGIPASAIYRIFPTISDVLMEVNHETFAELNAVFEEFPATFNAEQKLIETCRRYVVFMQENPNLWKALFEGQRKREAFPAWYREAIATLMARLADLLQDACPSLPRGYAQENAGRLYVLVHGAISLQFDGRLELITSVSVQDIARGAIEGLMLQLRDRYGVGSGDVSA